MESEIDIPINLGNPSEFTIKELAQKVRNLINTDLQFVYKPLPDPTKRRPVIEKAKKNYLATEISLEKG